MIQERIAHNKLSIEEIKRKETEVLEVLEFKLTGVTPVELLGALVLKLNVKELLSSKLSQFFEKLVRYLLKMMMYDYELVSESSYAEITVATLYVSFKIMEQLEGKFPVQEKVGAFSTK